MRQCFCPFDREMKNLPYLAYSSRVVEDEGPFSRFMHMHPDTAEIILITDGKGEYFIGDRVYSVMKGDLVIYNSGVVHEEYLGKARSVGTICCGIKNISRQGLRSNALIPDDVVPVFPLHHHYETVFMLMNATFTMLNQGSNNGPAMSQSLMQVLLEYIDSNVLFMTDAKAQPRNESLPECIKAFIDQNFQEPLRLETLSARFNVSPFYVSHEFKKRYGYSPMDYLIKRRLGEAQSLLTTAEGGREKITSIAYRVGFSNLSHFQSYFKSKVGKTPGQYRSDYRRVNCLLR